MRAFLVLAFCTVSSLTAKAQHGSEGHGNDDHEMEGHHCFFEERSVSLGLGLPYSFHAKAPGINARLYYNMGHRFCFGPEFSYFKTEEVEILDVDFIAHYIFETPITGVYPLLGLNYTMEASHGHEEAAPGVVFGAGLHRNFGSFTAFGEYARVQSNLADDFITAGIMYTF